MKNFVINSINGGVNVTFIHDDDKTHTETISGPLVPSTNENGELSIFLKEYALAWEIGKEKETQVFDPSTLLLIGNSININ